MSGTFSQKKSLTRVHAPLVNRGTPQNPDLEVSAASTSAAGSLSATDYASLHPPTVRVYNSANIATVSGVLTTLTFDAEDYDLSAMHSTSANTSRLTVVRAGRHQFGCAVEFAASNVTERGCFIYKNGGKVAGTVSQAGSTGAAALQAFYEGDCVIGDYFEVVVYQVTGVGININYVAGYSPTFWGRWCPKE